VLLTFLLARQLWGRRVAWLAAVVLTFGHYHLHFSRLGYGDIADGLFVVLALAPFVQGLRSGQAIYFALAGAAVGLGWYGYYGARLIGIIVAVYLAWRALVEYRFLARYGRLLALLLAAAIVVLAPLLFHYLDHPGEAISRARQVNILTPGWIEAEKAYWGVSAATIYWRQFWKAISAFHYTLDPTYHYHASIPLLDFVSGVLFILGMVWAIARRRWPANGLVLIWFWLAVIIGWALTENPPSSHRLPIVAPSVALIVGLGLNWLVNLCRRVFGGGRQVWGVATVMLLSVIAAINLRYYFVVYTPTLVYGNPTAEVATVLGRHLVEREKPCVVYFHAPPVMYWDLGNLRFLLRVYGHEIQGVDVYPPGEGQPPLPDLQRATCFVFLPERLGELENIHSQYPDGEETRVYSKADGRLLYVMYRVSPP
jgi:4-amino-4-deoxy-L-arabinose transferase-like glycosyltransferase